MAGLPVLFATVAIGALFMVETQQLEHHQSAVLEETLLGAKREEVRNYITLALTSIDHLYGAGRDDEAAKEQAKAILSSMNFGDDGYFFVYAPTG